MRILLIEDDYELRTVLSEKFEKKHFAVDAVADGINGYKRALHRAYDIIIADYALPGKNGFECCRDIKTYSDVNKKTPILVATAATTLSHTLLGFSVGADDYIAKPFYFDELYARIRSLLRRSHSSSQFLSFDTIEVDTGAQTVIRSGRLIELTRIEYNLLVVLLSHQKTIVPRAVLIEKIWDNAYNIETNSIETHMFNLRKKIEHPNERSIIFAIPHRGYKIDYQR